MWRGTLRVGITAGALGLLGACQLFTGVGCTDRPYAAVFVRIVDDATGLPVARESVLIIRDGAYADSARAQPEEPGNVLGFSAGFGRPGTYQVRVRNPAYQEWVREGVQVRRGGQCDKVQTVELTARLRR